MATLEEHGEILFADIAPSDVNQEFTAGPGYGAEWIGRNAPAIPTIQEMVANLRESAKEVHARVGDTETQPQAAEQRPSSSQQLPHAKQSTSGHTAEIHEAESGQDDSRPGLGETLATAVARALGANRFEVVRDSVTGEPTDSLLHPKHRPHAQARNIYTEAELLELDCKNIPEEALGEAIATGDAKDIPSGFQRLRSPRCSRQEPDEVHTTLQAQLNCLPMAYAAEFEGHLRDLRTLLGPDVWQRVQEAVDWDAWTNDEKLAALSRVLFPRGRETVLNANELEAPDGKPRQLQLGAAALRQQSSKRRRSTAADFEVIADYQGVSVKRHADGAATQALTEEQAVRLLRGLRRAANLPGDDGDGDDGAQRAQQLLRSVPAAAHTLPGSLLQPQRITGPPETFWEDLEAQVAEGLRQAQRAPRLVDLVTSTERALFLVSQQRHYAGLAARLFAQQVAATRIQAAWRGYRVRKWYHEFKATEAFAARQREYEAQMRERWEREEREAEALAQAEHARKLQAERRQAAQQDQNLQQWKQRARYMHAASAAAAKHSLPAVERKEQGRQFLEASKARAKKASIPPQPPARLSDPGTDPAPGTKASIDGSMPHTPLSREALESHSPELPSPVHSPSPSRRRRGPASIGGSSFSSMGTTSRAAGRRRRPDDTRSGWLSTHSTASEDPEERVLDESLATARLRERRQARQARREAARRLGVLRPEQQAAARSEEERISRRLAVMEEVLGADNAGRFEASMQAALASNTAADAGPRRRPSHDDGGLAAGSAALASLSALPTIRESPSGSVTGDSMRLRSSGPSLASSWAGGSARPTGTPPLGTRRSLLSLPASLADDEGSLVPVMEASTGLTESDGGGATESLAGHEPAEAAAASAADDSMDEDGDHGGALPMAEASLTAASGAASLPLAPMPSMIPLAGHASAAFAAASAGATAAAAAGAVSPGAGAMDCEADDLREGGRGGDQSIHGSEEAEEVPLVHHASVAAREVAQQVQRVSLQDHIDLRPHMHDGHANAARLSVEVADGRRPGSRGSLFDYAVTPKRRGSGTHAPGAAGTDPHSAHSSQSGRRLDSGGSDGSGFGGVMAGGTGGLYHGASPATAVPTRPQSGSRVQPRQEAGAASQYTHVAGHAFAALAESPEPPGAPAAAFAELAHDGGARVAAGALPADNRRPASRGMAVKSGQFHGSVADGDELLGAPTLDSGQWPGHKDAGFEPAAPPPPVPGGPKQRLHMPSGDSRQQEQALEERFTGLQPSLAAGATTRGHASSADGGVFPPSPAAEGTSASAPERAASPADSWSMAQRPSSRGPPDAGSAAFRSAKHGSATVGPVAGAMEQRPQSRGYNSGGSVLPLSARRSPPTVSAAGGGARPGVGSRGRARDQHAVRGPPGGGSTAAVGEVDAETVAAAAALIHAEESLRAKGGPAGLRMHGADSLPGGVGRMRSSSFARLASLGLAGTPTQRHSLAPNPGASTPPPQTQKPGADSEFLPHIQRRSTAAPAVSPTRSPPPGRPSQHTGELSTLHSMDAQLAPMPSVHPAPTMSLAPMDSEGGHEGEPDLLRLIRYNVSHSGQQGSTPPEQSGGGAEAGYGGTDLVAALLGRLDRELQDVGHEPAAARPPRGTRDTADQLPALPSMASSAAAVSTRSGAVTGYALGSSLASGALAPQPSLQQPPPRPAASMSQLNEAITQLRRGRTDGVDQIIKRTGPSGAGARR